MVISFFAFDHIHQEGAPATRPLAFMPFRVRLVTRLSLSLVVALKDSDPLRAKARVESYAGPGLPPPRFAAACGVVSALALTNPASSLRGHSPRRAIGRVQLRFLG